MTISATCCWGNWGIIQKCIHIVYTVGACSAQQLKACHFHYHLTAEYTHFWDACS